MEDFARDLKAATGLYLIYGDSGVGKTRLLEELVETRLAQSEIRWMDLRAGSSGDGALVDSSVMIEETFAHARPGDIIVADHFEMAQKKTRHQLLLSWSTDGVDKKLNLIISSHSDYFNDLRQLAQQYQVRIQSFQQLPFSADEACAFLAFYLFPDRTGVKLSVPPLLRDQLGMTLGSVGKIVEIAERAGDQMTSETEAKTETQTETEPKPQNRRIVAAVLVTVAIIVGVGWYLIDGQSGIDGRNFAEPESPEINQLASAQTVPAEPAGPNDSETDNELSSEIANTEVENAYITEAPSAGKSDVTEAVGDSQMESFSAETDQGASELAADLKPISGPTSGPIPGPTAAPQGEAETVIVTRLPHQSESNPPT